MFDFELKIGLKFIFALNFPPGTPSMLPKNCYLYTITE